MPKPDLEDSIDELPPDQMAKILKDLAADAATKESVVAAVQLAHEQVSQNYAPSNLERKV